MGVGDVIMAKLLTSRRFWTFIVAQLISIVGVVIAHYVNDPFGTQLAGMGIMFVEGLAGFLIAAYTIDDINSNTEAIKAGVHPDYPRLPLITSNYPPDGMSAKPLQPPTDKKP
jgi:hypothetical protein